MVLSDFGAEVIKIEPPGGEVTRQSGPFVNGASVYFAMYNRGKKFITLDLRKPEGMEIFKALVPTADFVLENFRPGTMEQMGLDYEALCA
jgi:crotonobetainyl-CoA:carnitine CoA-transferase CaiB-like acyl-CoA transferase